MRSSRHYINSYRTGGLRVATVAVALAVVSLAELPAQTSSTANAAATPLIIGETFSIRSAVLNEARRINVYLPPGYAEASTQRFPVLYMPDGGMAEDFLHVAGLVQVSVGNGTMRPFILVGIENTERRRDMTGPTTVEADKRIAPRVGGSAAFRSFLRSELMPAIRDRYRATAETAIVGESLAGLFVMETLVLEPALFDTYIAFDPSLWWNNQQLARSAKDRLGSDAYSGKSVFLASSGDAGLDTALRALTDEVARGANRSSGGMRWIYEPMPGETHATIYHPAALRAFRTLFKPAPQRR